LLALFETLIDKLFDDVATVGVVHASLCCLFPFLVTFETFVDELFDDVIAAFVSIVVVSTSVSGGVSATFAFETLVDEFFYDVSLALAAFSISLEKVFFFCATKLSMKETIKNALLSIMPLMLICAIKPFILSFVILCVVTPFFAAFKITYVRPLLQKCTYSLA
jgi:hypothetical protein